MTDNKLKEQLEKLSVPAPEKEAQERAFSAAMEEFTKIQETSQGSAGSARPTSKLAGRLNQLGRNFMKKTTLIGGTVAAAAIVLALNATTLLTPAPIPFTKSTPPVQVKPLAKVDEKKPQIPAPTDTSTGTPAPVEGKTTAAAAVTPPPSPAIPAPSTEVAQSKGDSVADHLAPSKQEQHFAKEESEKNGAPVSASSVVVQDMAAATPVSPPSSAPASITQGGAAGNVENHLVPRGQLQSGSESGMRQEVRAKDKELRLDAAKKSEAKMMPMVGGIAQGAPGVAYEQNYRDNSSVTSHLIARPTICCPPYPRPIIQPQPSGDQFEKFEDSPLKLVAQEPVSTFSIDVDTSSYSFLRREINNGQWPQRDAVRVEELINYFDYDYALPEDKSKPFEPTVAVYPTPWNKETKLVHIGIKGYEIPASHKPRSNIVLLIDTSGSMAPQDRLPLVVSAFRMLVDNLEPDDTVGIVTYAGYAGVALEPTSVRDKEQIISVLDRLHSGGGTAGAQGIQQAYSLAQRKFDKEGINRVILATDGDFNIGITNREELKQYVSDKRKTGIYLSVLGVGKGNYNDAMMQTLAQNGNGNASYIDSLNEARKLLVQEATSTLFTIARDVKIQVEFNPSQVSEYRLIGYETRALKREDFNNDKVDAGEIGSGHAVTAIYEITPAGSHNHRYVDDMRYAPEQKKEREDESDRPIKNGGELAFLKIRYKLPDSDTSTLITRPITKDDEVRSVDKLDDDVRFAGAVAAYGQLLRGDSRVANYSFDEVVKLAEPARGKDEFGYRAEFLNLARMAESLRKSPVIQPEPPIVEPQPYPVPMMAPNVDPRRYQE